MELPHTRMHWMRPTRFFFHRDLTGEVALDAADHPILCVACSDVEVAAATMERLGVAPPDSQCRRCDRFSWGRSESCTPRRR